MMIHYTHKSDYPVACLRSVTLPWEKRLKSRQKAELDNGEEVGLILPRGSILRGGDCLLADNGEGLLIIAASEELSHVSATDPLLMNRFCYHLGNRHVSLEISDEGISYIHDHVLDEMVVQLGGNVTKRVGPFEPEHGAYSGSHGHDHG